MTQQWLKGGCQVMMNIAQKKHFLLGLGIFMGMLLVGAAVFGIKQFRGPDKQMTIAQEPLHATPTTINKPTKRILTNQLIQYTTLPGAVRSAIRVTVNNQVVFVERYKDISYVRFAFTGAARVTVTAVNAASYSISPRRYSIHPTVHGQNLSFTLHEPRQLILQAGSDKLFLFADAPEQHAPNPTASNVLDVTRYVNDISGRSIQTAHIQQAIYAAATQHAILYFPAGLYRTGTLNMRSNASLYLSSGALLSGTGYAWDTPDSLLLFKDVQNVRLFGHGAIDLHGMALRNSAGDAGRVKLIRTINANNITLQDITLRDSGSWTVHILDSHTIRVNNLKILNDPTMTNNDGIDPDSSNNVSINGAFIYTGDDCFAVKTSGALHLLAASHNISIENSICYTRKSALKVGTETRATLSNITFQQNDVIHADRAIALYMADGSIMNNIKYLNTTSEAIGGNIRQRLIDIEISDRNGIGTIDNVTIANYTAYAFSPNPSLIAGLDGHMVNVTFRNLRIAGTSIHSAAAAMIGIQQANVKFPP
ncbi:glycoside hydrolase family 28 protein [Dictyobacter arantiisoli]|uniref:Pectate lyase superfamily protein domain-containing protein n=1 Tax=Dictyobacter arantiisoli TaxID=2014874 RepID=A0A5A5TJS2_9CHLR|nr:glycosyl hydrolase family 28 protein [Dictyobacter arantiisoli]GCF11505.1 hypothetical protein KDI_50690 [Dictyobacter arantiisoli]